MAITASNIIRRALKLISAVDAAVSLPALDAQDALDTLNAMLAEWHAAGMNLPVYEFAALETELPTDAGDRDGIAYALALRLAPEYQVPVSVEFQAAAQQAVFRLRSRYWQAPHPITADYY